MSDARPRLQVKAEVLHEPHEQVSEDRIADLMGSNHVDDVRISPGHRASAVFVTFKAGRYYVDKVGMAANSAAYWMEDQGYADSVDVNRVWISATSPDNE